MLKSAPVLHPPQRVRSQPTSAGRKQPLLLRGVQVWLRGLRPKALRAQHGSSAPAKRLTEAQITAYLMRSNPYELLGVEETALPPDKAGDLPESCRDVPHCAKDLLQDEVTRAVIDSVRRAAHQPKAGRGPGPAPWATRSDWATTTTRRATIPVHLHGTAERGELLRPAFQRGVRRHPLRGHHPPSSSSFPGPTRPNRVAYALEAKRSLPKTSR